MVPKRIATTWQQYQKRRDWPLFHGVLEPSILDDFLLSCSITILEKGKVLKFSKNNEMVGSLLFMLIDGYVEVWTELESNSVQCLGTFIDFRGPGQVLGEIALIRGSRCPALIRASERVTLLRIPFDEMKSRIDIAPIYRNLCRLVCDKLDDGVERNRVVSTVEMQQRVASGLIALQKLRQNSLRAGDPYNGRIHGELTQDLIADYVGNSRTNITPILKLFKENQVIQYSKNGKYTIKNQAMLLRLASGGVRIELADRKPHERSISLTG